MPCNMLTSVAACLYFKPLMLSAFALRSPVICIVHWRGIDSRKSPLVIYTSSCDPWQRSMRQKHPAIPPFYTRYPGIAWIPIRTSVSFRSEAIRMLQGV